jgi:alpha-N-arabinofuranosidase
MRSITAGSIPRAVLAACSGPDSFIVRTPQTESQGFLNASRADPTETPDPMPLRDVFRNAAGGTSRTAADPYGSDTSVVQAGSGRARAWPLTQPLRGLVRHRSGLNIFPNRDGRNMIKRIAATVVLLFAGLPAGAMAQQRMVVNADLGEHTINRHIYGHFAEHLGRDIYDGFWTQAGTGEWHLRDDIIQALREIQIPNLRWPGGCFADYYHWEDGIGPREDRPVMVNTVWGGVTEDNSFGTHEFMELVERLDTEPFIVGNVGSGTVEEMANWWEYLNHPGGSTLADLRAANGHPEPYGVEFWGVGNESWGCGGDMTPEYYADQFKRFSTFLRRMGDTRPFLVATGPNSGNYEWMEGVLSEAGNDIDGIDLHYYTRVRRFGGGFGGFGQPQQGPRLSRSATDFGEAEWFVAMQNAQRIDELITNHSAIMDQHDPDKEVWLIVGEWGMWHSVEPGTNPGFLYQQNTMRDAVVAGQHLNVFNNHAERVKMANIAQTVNVLQAMVLTRGEEMILTPTYHVFEMYTPHHDATLLPIELDAGTYAYEGQEVDAVNASASRDSEGRVHITLTNMDPNQARTISVQIRGQQVSQVSGRVLTADAMNAHNTFEAPNTVRPEAFDGASLSGQTLTVELPSKSVVALELR